MGNTQFLRRQQHWSKEAVFSLFTLHSLSGQVLQSDGSATKEHQANEYYWTNCYPKHAHQV